MAQLYSFSFPFSSFLGCSPYPTENSKILPRTTTLKLNYSNKSERWRQAAPEHIIEDGLRVLCEMTGSGGALLALRVAFECPLVVIEFSPFNVSPRSLFLSISPE